MEQSHSSIPNVRLRNSQKTKGRRSGALQRWRGTSFAYLTSVAQVGHRLRTWTLNVGSAGALVGCIAALDDRVGTVIANVVTTASFGELAIAGARAHRFAQSAVEMIGLQSPEYATMAMFACAGVGLLVLSLRT